MRGFFPFLWGRKLETLAFSYWSLPYASCPMVHRRPFFFSGSPPLFFLPFLMVQDMATDPYGRITESQLLWLR